MDLPVGIPRSRGAISGALLILLGLWGGLAPFVGPYFHFGVTPDRVWAYDTARLYYSIAPAAVVLFGGMVVLATRNRAVGILGGVLALLGGAWFILGESFVRVVLKHASVTAGGPIGPASAGVTSIRMYLETLTLFGGLGVLILVFGALAIGRFSMLAAGDLDDESDEDSYPAAPATVTMRKVVSAPAAGHNEADQYAVTGQASWPGSAPPPALFPEPPDQYPDAPAGPGEPAP